MANIYTPKETALPVKDAQFGIFLAGSIEMGKAKDWQSYAISKLSEYNVDIYNPRRKINPVLTDKEDIHYQINWELDFLERANIILMHFEPNTISPISLLELGLHMKNKEKLVVVSCNEGYSRFDNVSITCDAYGVTVFDTLDKAIEDIIWYIKD